MHVRGEPPNRFGMAVGPLLEFKVPEGLQWYTRSGDGGDDDCFVDHNKDEDPLGGAADPRISPDADIQKQDGDLRAPKAKLIEKNRPPASLTGVSGRK